MRNANINILVAVTFCCLRLSSALMSRKFSQDSLMCLAKQGGKKYIIYDNNFVSPVFHI